MSSRIEATYPLSPLQHGMLFHALSEPTSGVDIEQMVCTFSEEMDVALLQSAWREAARRHSVLRTGFDWHGERAVQHVWQNAEAEWQDVDLRELPEEERELAFQKMLRTDRRRGFDMAVAPLVRFAFFRLSAGESRLVWTFHHALLDGRSFPIILRDVFALYEGKELPEAPRPFRDHIAWLEGRADEDSAPFWREKLQGFHAPTALPVRGIGALASEPEQADCELRLNENSTAALEQIAGAYGITLNTLVQGAWALLLSRYSREEDIVFGATRACRRSCLEGASEMVGLFINTLPMRVQVPADTDLISWLQELRAQWVEMRPYEHTPLAAVQAVAQVSGGRALFDTIVVFENYELNDVLRGAGVANDRRAFRLYEQTNFSLTLAAYGGPELLLRMEFNRQHFATDTITRLLGHLGVILESFGANPRQRLGDVPIVNAVERTELLDAGRSACSIEDPGATLPELFARQVARSPDAVAVTCGDDQLTYVELDQRASQVARHLEAFGVGPEIIVGLCVERSLDLVVGLLGILKAGAAYLPLDLAYPPERLGFILEDAQAPLLLTHSTIAASLPAHTSRVVCIDQLADANNGLGTRCGEREGQDTDLAYVIYTSGSTGKPKGCCITHRNVVRLFHATEQWFGFGASDVWTMFHSVAFDFSVWEIWGALLYGGRLVIVPHTISRAPEAFRDLLARERVTVLNQTPSAFRQLVAEELTRTTESLLPLRYVIFGGEALEMQSLKPWFDRYGDAQPQLINMYGITETTVHVTYRPLGAADVSGGSVIGRAIPDLHLYILNPSMTPVPIGVPGEMFVGGAGVARGYLRRPELTADRFIQSPFSPGECLYRTGDLARWMPDFDVEYLGRIDQQVKIRGFRIELGEIESVLLQHRQVRGAAVVARQDDRGEKRLVAYVVAHREGLPGTSELRAHLKTKLPDYMVPAAFVTVERLPLTANGKLDVRALPAPEPERPQLANAFVSPRTPKENALAEIWGKVLRLERVGVHDNFFELGGDSILSILVVSRARQAGLPITPKHLFEYQTIAELAIAIPTGVASEEEASSGEVSLAPIQEWFFEHDFEKPQHWNQAFIFRTTEPLEHVPLTAAVHAVALHHASFRTRYFREGTSIRARCEHLTDGARLAMVARLSMWNDASLAAAQTAFDLACGPLLCVAYLDNRALIAAHHLAVDGVSWRILIEDLTCAYRQACAGERIVLPRASTSAGRWAQLLIRASRSETFEREIPHWRAIAEESRPPLPVDHRLGENTESSARTAVATLTREETTALLQRLPAVLKTRIHDALLTALALAVGDWTAEQRLLIDVEGHGREEALVAESTGTAPADLSRTIGWFTSIYPVSLQLFPKLGAGAEGDAPLIARISRQLQQIPSRGLGFGMLKYLRGERITSRAEILFNYLGQFERALGESDLFHLTGDSTGAWHSPAAQRTHLIEINCLVVDGQLEARWIYSENFHRDETITGLAHRFVAELRALIMESADKSPLVPEIVRPAVENDAEEYALAPLQELYFALETARRNAGFDQWHCLLRGSLDVDRFRAAWTALFARHSILRTRFVAHEGVRQRVEPRAEPDFVIEDWRALGPEEQRVRFEEFLRADEERGFDVSVAPLTRLSLLRINDNEWRLVWSHHHLQIDGWSWPLLFRELSDLYAGATLGQSAPYRRFIEWLAQRPGNSSQTFWREQLRGFLAPTPLPAMTMRRAKTEDSVERSFRLRAEQTHALQARARQSHVTLSVLVQAAWAILLSRHGRTEDVLFGASFSGRSHELENVESIAGPFVTNLPIRIHIRLEESLDALFKRLHAQTVELGEHQFATPAEIHACSELGWHQRLFETLVVFQNYLAEDGARGLGPDIRIDDLVAPIRTNFPLTIVAVPGAELKLSVIVSAQSGEAAAAVIGEQLLALLSAFAKGSATSARELQPLLPAISAEADAEASEDRRYVAPHTELERNIAAVWSDAFGIKEVSAEDNFFDLGGHSLMMIQVHARLTEVLHRRISIVRMFQHPTIRALARHLEAADALSDGERKIVTAAQSRAEKQRAALSRRKVLAQKS